MPSIKLHLLNYLLRRVSERAGPSTLSSGSAEAENYNCFYTWVLKGGERDFVILRVVEGEAHGLRYNDDRSKVEVSVPIAEISPGSLRITHHYGTGQVQYVGAWSALRGAVSNLKCNT